jgi:TolC family type I secretion outer membrane protein
MRYKILFSFFLCMMICCFGYAEEGHADSLVSLLEQVATEHEQVKAAEARRDAAAQALSASRAGRLPRVDVLANIGPEWIDPTDDAATTSEVKNYQSIRASQILLDFGKSGSLISRAQAYLAQAETTLQAARQEILYKGISAYLDVHRQTLRLKYALHSEQRIMDMTGLEEVLVEKQAGLASDVLQAKSQLAGARALRIAIEGQLANAKSAFRGVFGSRLSDAQIAELVMPPLPLDAIPGSVEHAVSIALEQSPELIFYEQVVAMIGHEVEERRAMLYPDIHLVGEAKRRYNESGIIGTKNEAVAMVELTYNLFQGGRDLAELRAVGSRLTDARQQLEDMRRQVEERVHVAWQTMHTSRASAELLRNQTVILEEFLVLAQRERLLGTRSLLDVLSGEVNHINALSNAVSSEMDQALSIYGLLYAMGRLDLEHIH